MYKHFYKNDMVSNQKNNLNDSQQEAVKHPGGPLLVLAGAGSGKTRIITERISYLINKHNVSPSNILAVTFTNKAANEMKQRVARLVQKEARNLWIGTFHSTCLRILKREINKLDGYSRDFIIYDDADQIKLIKDCMVRLNIGERLLSPKHVGSQIDSAKNKGLGPDSSELNDYDKRVLRIYSLYEVELRKSNALDFGDLLHVTIMLFEKKPEVLQNYQNQFQHILVDEYQDTNHVQYRIVELLSRIHKNIFVVGDDNQSIYGWRGADIKNILNFEKDYSNTQIIKLERNYRSTKTILEAANKLILQNKNRHDKNLWTENATGDQINYYEARDDKDEAKHVSSQIGIETKNRGYSYKDIAIFFRTNTQSRLIEEELLRSTVPYKIVGGTEFYKRAEIKDILAFLKVITNPSDEISLKRIINVPPRGIGKITVNKLDEIAREKDVPFFDGIQLALEEKLLPSSALVKLEKLFNLLTRLIEFPEKNDIVSLINDVLHKTGYLDMLEKEEERRENIGEILNLAAEFGKERDKPTLNDFLDNVSLASDLDNFSEDADKVTLMTLHSAKGLEFPVVFIIGMEENLIPHFNSTRNGQVEEERRLFYVGITRAKEKVYLAGATRRMTFGKQQACIPSRFISELPKELIKWENFDYSLMDKTRGSKRSSTKPISRTRITYEKSGRYRVGQKVVHSSFGEGLIKKVEGSGDEAKVTVFFPAYGFKKIIASYLE